VKLKKRTTLLVSFTVGALLLATTALADIANKDGYEQLKDSLKSTAASCSSQLDSFTMETSMVFKDNGKVVLSDNEVNKYDMVNGAAERSSSHESAYSDSYSSYSYNDKTTDIYSNTSSSTAETWNVVEYSSERENPTRFQNPFEVEEAGDVERIADALVGSLRDQVFVKENADGSRDLSGTLTEVQIPALVNAVASLQIKQQFNGQRHGAYEQAPQLTQDIFIKEISGSAVINKDGLMESILGTAILSGKDSEGTMHEFTAEVLISLKDIDATVVSKPDLTGKNVIVEEGKQVSSGPEIANPEKFIGDYKNDIIIEKDGKFVKIGERLLVIAHLDQSSIAGNYKEVYEPGFEQYASGTEFTFEASFNNDPRSSEFSYTTASGSKGTGNIFLDDYTAKVNFYLNSSSRPFDGNFSPIFE